MEYIFLVFIIGAVAFITYKSLKRKQFPSNNYTPFDDLMEGKKESSKSYVVYEEEEK